MNWWGNQKDDRKVQISFPFPTSLTLKACPTFGEEKVLCGYIWDTETRKRGRLNLQLSGCKFQPLRRIPLKALDRTKQEFEKLHIDKLILTCCFKFSGFPSLSLTYDDINQMRKGGSGRYVFPCTCKSPRIFKYSLMSKSINCVNSRYFGGLEVEWMFSRLPKNIDQKYFRNLPELWTYFSWTSMCGQCISCQIHLWQKVMIHAGFTVPLNENNSRYCIGWPDYISLKWLG